MSSPGEYLLDGTGSPALRGEIRKFETGATRDSDNGKLDYEGFLSPAALERYAEYMHTHRLQPDGNLRDSDNWQKGMSKEVYIKSLWRHFMDLWKLHRGLKVVDRITGKGVSLQEALCAILFNTFGYLHESLKLEQPTQ